MDGARVIGVLAVAVALAGCGSSGKTKTSAVVKLPAYGVFPATTVSVSPSAADSRTCRADAQSFAETARMFLAHSGPQAAYPADLYYVILREALADFRARRCAASLLGAALERSLTAGRRAALVDGLPRSMAETVRASLAARQRKLGRAVRSETTLGQSRRALAPRRRCCRL